MIKGQVKELVLERLEKQATLDSTLFKEYIEIYMNAAITDAFYKSFAEAYKSDLVYVPGAFVYTTPNVPVSFDTDRNKMYLELPARPMTLPNNAGIIYVGPNWNEEEYYVILDQTSAGRLTETELIMSSRVFGVLEGVKIYFLNLHRAQQTLMVKVVSSVSFYEDEDELPIPAGYEKAVIDACVDFFLGKKQIPEEKINDNREDIK